MIKPAAVLLSLAVSLGLVAGEPAPPNVLLIMADDLGFSDLGCYGGEISTPNLDRLAGGGLVYTQFYNTARCWPSRASLMTGFYPQQVRRDAVPGVKATGGRGKRPEWAPLLPERLKPAGYRSYHVGKWHIDGMPLAEGFDRSYYLKDQGRFFNPKTHWLDDKALPAVEKDSGFYATRALADRTIEFLEEHQQKHADQPFFTYLAFAAPHFPLHALPEDIEAYDGKYDAGWDVVRERRWDVMGGKRAFGFEQPSAVERELGPPYAFPDAMKILGEGEVNRPLPWAALTEAQRQFQADKMEIHAAMIHRMDREIGRVLKKIESVGRLENTLVMFLSDNGASAEIMVRSDGHDPVAPRGSAASYLCLGPGWSTVCNTPFRRHKTWVHEGGIASPLIVSWPKHIGGNGSSRSAPAHIIDLPATVLDLAGVEVEGKPLVGQSLATGFKVDDPERSRALWWCHENNRAVRVGDWKLVAAKGDPWALYNMASDRAEANDLSSLHPAKVKELESVWKQMMAEFAKDAKS